MKEPDKIILLLPNQEPKEYTSTSEFWKNIETSDKKCDYLQDDKRFPLQWVTFDTNDDKVTLIYNFVESENK